MSNLKFIFSDDCCPFHVLPDDTAARAAADDPHDAGAAKSAVVPRAKSDSTAKGSARAPKKAAS